MNHRECRIMKYLCEAYEDCALTNDDFADFLSSLLVSENGYVTDCGTTTQVNAEIAIRLYKNIKKHPKLWKLFMVA